MVVPQVEIITELKRSQTKIDLSLANGSSPHPGPTHSTQLTTQTWPFVEIFAHKRYFYLEAQSFSIDGHPEIFLWLWFLGKKNTKGIFPCKILASIVTILVKYCDNTYKY